MTPFGSSPSGEDDAVPLVHASEKHVAEVRGPDTVVDLLEADGELPEGVGEGERPEMISSW